MQSPSTSFFTLGAWLLPAIGTFFVQRWMALGKAAPHGLLPGMSELVLGSAALGAVAVFCGVMAFIRGERWRWASAPIAAAGLLFLLWFAVVALAP